MYRCEAGAAPAGHQEPTTSLYSHVRILLNSHSNDRNIVLLNVKLPTQVFNSGTLNHNCSNLSHNRLSNLTVSITKKNADENYLFIYLPYISRLEFRQYYSTVYLQVINGFASKRQWRFSSVCCSLLFHLPTDFPDHLVNIPVTQSCLFRLSECRLWCKSNQFVIHRE